eukprot:TRINITY_DN11761_c0_g1_i10.p1 TRINITY_DN11761_c0_g1~~TRINITY_DN11761_c0_g1_i10.p1  ORF type:complete len:908 (-),score=266.39 TRINITY_DN11761_c0_g1_i10:19-2742(-)
MADVLPQPPFDFEKEPLVTGSVELGTERLANGFSWLVSCIQEQHRLLGSMCERMDGLEDGGAAAGSARPAASQSLQSSMKEEMLSMQLSTLRHEVASLPRPGDLERQRERLMAEVTNLSGSLADRQRESDDRVQKELAAVTDSLCKQLERISTDVSGRLAGLEEQLASVAGQAQAPGSSGSRGIGPPGEAALGAGLGGLALPEAVIPLSPSQQAEDTEDHTDPVSPSAQAAVAPYDGPSGAALAELDSRIDSRIATLERQIADLAARQAEASQSPPPAPQAAVLAGAVPAAGADVAAAAAEAVAAARAADAEVLEQLRGTLAELSVQFQEIKVEHVRDVEALRSQVQEVDSRQTAAAEAFAVSMESPATETGAKAQVAAEDFPTSQPLAPGVSPEDLASLQSAVQEQLGQLQGRLQSVEASLGAVESTLPEFKKAVPELEASLRKVEEALARVSEGPESLGGGNVDAAVLVVDAVPAAEVAEEEIAAKATKPSQAAAPSSSAGLLGRLQSLEEWRGKVESKLARPAGVALASVAEFDEAEEDEFLEGEEDFEGPVEDSQLEDEAKAAGTRSRAAKAPPAAAPGAETAGLESQHGPPGGRWKDVQAELERFRKLFEFVEGVLPDDAAEAMRFFNRRQQSASSLSEHVSKILGPEVDFAGHKTKLEQEFKKNASAMRNEFENLSLVMKGLQRDVEASGGKIQDLGKRMRQVEGDVRGQALGSAHITSEEQPFQEPSPRPSEKQDAAKEELPSDYVSKNVLTQGLEELREEVRKWLELLRSSVLTALQTKADSDQLTDFAKQVMSQNGDIALFAKRQLVGKCASCEAPIEADLLRVKRPQAVGLQRPWPVHGTSLGAQVNIRQPSSNGQSGAVSSQRLPKIQDPRSGGQGKALKGSASSPEIRKEMRESP